MTETALESGSHPEGEVRPDETAVTADPAPAAPDQSEKPDPSLTAAGEKLDRVTRNWRALERDRDHWREMAMRTQTPSQPAKSEPVAEPQRKLADFEYDESKYEAYRTEQATRHAVKAARDEIEREQAQRQARERFNDFQAREAKFAESVKDYADVAHYAPLSTQVAQAVMEMDEGPAVAYYLGKNPEIAEKISELPERRAAIELGRLEARLIAEREAAKKPAVSKAPPPTPKIDAGDAAVDTDPSQMTDAQFAKWRKRQIAQRRN